MNPQRWRSALAFAFILLLSSFWPLTVTAQENATVTDESNEGIANDFSTTPLCSLTGVEVKNLNRDEAVAIQGIVTQDVATSAERYREQQAALKFGLNRTQDPETQKRQNRLEKYNLYFMGPDGAVFYATVLKDQVRRNNEWLIGTTIDGRVEYGGMMGEDLAICPELPVNETSDGICTKRTGEKTDDFNIKPGGYTTGFLNQTAETIGTSWITLVNSLPLLKSGPKIANAWGYISLNPSRLMASKWTTTMAVYPTGGAIFVIPRTYLYFVSRMKTLAVFDMATQAVFMGAAFGTLLKPLGKYFGRTLGLKSSTSIKKMFTRIDDELVDGKKTFNTLDNQIADLASRGKIKKLQDLLTKAKEKARLYRENVLTQVRSKLGPDEYEKWYTELRKIDSIKVKDAQKRGEKVYTLLQDLGFKKDAIAKEIVEVKDYKYARPQDLYGLLGRMQADDILSRARISSAQDLVNPEMFRLTKMLKKVGVKYDDTDKAFFSRRLLEDFEDMSEKEKRLDEILTQLAAGEKGAPEVAIQEYLNFKTRRPIDEIFDFVRTHASRPRATEAMMEGGIGGKRFLILRNIASGEWMRGTEGGLRFFPNAKVSYLTIRAFQFPQLVTTSFLRGLYFYARPVVLIAYGLHLTGLLLESKGFLEVSSPGLTLHWDPKETGSLLTPKSFILLFGVPKKTTFYEAGVGGYLINEVRGFLTTFGVEPTLAGKYSELGQNLLFGGIMYENYPSIIEVQKEKPKGITEIEQTNNGYLMRLRNWENHAMIMVEDPASMRMLQDKAVTAMGMRTSNIDMYKHTFGEVGKIKSVFPKTWGLSQALSNWGTQTSFITLGTVLFLLPSMPVIRYPLAPLLLQMFAKGVFGAGKGIMTSKITSMRDLERCYYEENYTSDTIDCTKRPPCEAVEARCEAKIGILSMYLGISGTIQLITNEIAVLAPVNLGLGIVDYIVMSGPGKFKGKMEITSECMQDLLTCSERSFLIIGGSQYEDPSVVKAEQEQSKELKNLPGLENLPLDKFLEGFKAGKNDTLLKPAQMQLNIHSEMENATGRIAFKQIYYVHLKDAKIDWLTSDLPIHLCPVENGDVNDSLCVTIDDQDLRVGGRTIVSNELVPFRWMDETLPAMVIPNTAVAINLNETTDCSLFISDPSGKVVRFNPTIIATFAGENFEELARSMGPLRDIETDKGAIYPNMDYNGNYRWEMDYVDGSFKYSTQPVAVTAKAKVEFNNQTFGFKSAIFEGGVIIKKGDKIYIVPKYFKPPMSAMDWLRATKGQPFVSDTGAPLEVTDEYGRLIGINASNTRIPGGDKLGMITRVDASKDLNGNGIIEDNETAGFRFYTDENNQTKMDLWYDGKRETYDWDQIEIDEKTGCIRIYEKGKEHVQANLLREVCLKTLPNGVTELHISDREGNPVTEPRVVDWIVGTGGAIKYDPNTNNYVFVNGQPIQLNNEFKTHGFNAVTGRPEPPLLQPSAVDEGLQSYPGGNKEGGIKVPIRPTDWTVVIYLLVLVGGIFTARALSKRKKRETP